MHWIKEYLAILLQLCLRIFPINSHKIFSYSYGGQGYGDQGKYVCDELVRTRKDLIIIWPLSKSNCLGQAPDQVRVVNFGSLSFFYHLATSKVWISNMRIPPYFKKRRGQYYIQLWHGAPALKRVEKDVQEVLPRSYIRSAKNDSKMADLFISNSHYWTDLIRKAFWYNGAILECGTPRLDRLINRNAQTKAGIKKKLHIAADKVLLYAPTFRRDSTLSCYALDYQNLKRALEIKTGFRWHMCVRLHPNVVNRGFRLPNIPGVGDFSKYPNMYELLEITDLLITDYSSLMFEAGFAAIPVFLFATDVEEYQKDRGFYFDLAKLPFPIAQSNREMIRKIENWDEKGYARAIAQFKAKLGVREIGTASKQVAQHILDVLNATN